MYWVVLMADAMNRSDCDTSYVQSKMGSGTVGAKGLTPSSATFGRLPPPTRSQIVRTKASTEFVVCKTSE